MRVAGTESGRSNGTPPETAQDKLVDWIVEAGAGYAKTDAFVDDLCLKIRECGVAISRMTTGIPILHPLVYVSSYLWSYGGTAEERLFKVNPGSNASYQSSPIRSVYETGVPVRRRLNGQADTFDYPILQELKAEGVQDYLVLPMVFSDGSTKALTFATNEPEGFSDGDIALLRHLVPRLALVFEIHTLRRTATTLLSTYLGHQTGQKVLDGKVKRGDGDDVFAVIWFCDLRGSTPLADKIGRREFLDILNRFLECMAGAVLDHGGEVLRFIGDAGLAIFPIADPESTEEMQHVCDRALKAAQDAMARVTKLNAELASEDMQPVDYGIGLHLGEVMYGNIGAPERLEFTVIGAAANEAARVESLTKELGQTFVASKAVQQHVSAEMLSLGKQPLKGVPAPMEVFTFPR